MPGKRHSGVEDRLLNEDEQAAFHQIDAALDPELEDVEEDSHHLRSSSRCERCLNQLAAYLCDKSTISVFVMLLVLALGVALLEVSRSTDVFPVQGNVSHIVAHASTFIISAGLFGSMGGIANILALHMLFYRIRFCYGTGVIVRQSEQIGNVIRMIVLQMLFDSEHLHNYVEERLSRFSAEVNIAECISQAMHSGDAERIIEAHMNRLYSQPESYFLQALGISRSKLKPMIHPSVLSLCAETAPLVVGNITGHGQAISVPDFREAMDKYLRKRITQLASGDRMAKVMKDLMFRHLGWLVVSGSVMGCFIGLLAQALRLTVDPVFS